MQGVEDVSKTNAKSCVDTTGSSTAAENRDINVNPKDPGCEMSNRLLLRYSVVGVALICMLLLVAIKNQPLPKNLTKTGHMKSRLKHNKNNLNIGRQKGGRQPQGIDTYKDFKAEPESISYEDYSSYFYGSSESVSISSSFYGNRSRVHTSFSSSSDSWVDEGDAKFLEELKLKNKLKRQKKIQRKKAQRAHKLGAAANMDVPVAANVRMRNGAIIDEEGNIIKMVAKKGKDKKNKTETRVRPRRSLEDMEDGELAELTTTVESRQRERQERMKTYCEVRGKVDISDYTKKHILVVPEHRLMYCFVPKAGCSNWKRILMVLTGQRDSVDGLTSDEVHINGKFQYFSGLPLAKQKEVLETYYKFTFVREPMGRLLSVYRNKFGDKVYYRKNKSFHSFGKGIIKHFRQNATKHQKISGEGVTWREFSRYLLSPQVRKKYESGEDVHRKDHWDVQARVTSPCDVGYDFVGHMETLEEDATYLLRKWGVQDKVQYLPGNTSRPTNSNDGVVLDRNFEMLAPEQRERLYGLFREDYEAFGYEKPPFIN